MSRLLNPDVAEMFRFLGDMLLSTAVTRGNGLVLLFREVVGARRDVENDPSHVNLDTSTVPSLRRIELVAVPLYFVGLSDLVVDAVVLTDTGRRRDRAVAPAFSLSALSLRSLFRSLSLSIPSSRCVQDKGS